MPIKHGYIDCSTCTSTSVPKGCAFIPQDDTKDAYCTCAAGYSGSQGVTKCLPCIEKTYKPYPGCDSCMICMGDNVTTNGVAQTECVCAPGYTGDNCAPCAIGTYKTGYGNQACKQCSGNTTTAAVGADSASLCVCAAGYGGAHCSRCPRNTYSDSATNNECTGCPEGFISDTTGNVSPDQCNICDKGYYGSSCEPCPIGQYKDFFGEENCLSCADGFVTAQTGAAEISLCVCPAGRYLANPNATSCTLCPENTYKPAAGNSYGDCVVCDTDKHFVVSQDRTECICDSGYQVSKKDQ